MTKLRCNGEPCTWRRVSTVRGQVLGNLPQQCGKGREILYLPARHRISEQALCGYFHDSDLLSRFGKLSEPVYGCLARGRAGPAPRPDRERENPAFEDDFPATILGDDGR